MALAHCNLGKSLGVGWHCFPPPLDVPTFSARCLHVQRRERPLAAEGGNFRGREMFRQISSRIRLPLNSRDLLHAANLRHGTEGFTSPPKEGVLRIFSPLKIRRLRPGLNPRTWVPKASTLPLTHTHTHTHRWKHIALLYTYDLLSNYSGIWTDTRFVYHALSASFSVLCLPCNPWAFPLAATTINVWAGLCHLPRWNYLGNVLLSLSLSLSLSLFV